MKRKSREIEVTLRLRADQIRDAYRQLVQSEGEDWFYEPEVLEELKRRDKQGLRELQMGKTIPWEKLRKELLA